MVIVCVCLFQTKMNWSFREIQRFATANNLDVKKSGKGVTKAKLLQSIRNLSSEKTSKKDQRAKSNDKKKGKDNIKPKPTASKKSHSVEINNFQRN